MDRPEVVGFFDVNRVSPLEYDQLRQRGWVGVLGDPHRVVCWRKSWFARVCERLVLWFRR